jgi:hypothetical protein
VTLAWRAFAATRLVRMVMMRDLAQSFLAQLLLVQPSRVSARTMPTTIWYPRVRPPTTTAGCASAPSPSWVAMRVDVHRSIRHSDETVAFVSRPATVVGAAPARLPTRFRPAARAIRCANRTVSHVLCVTQPAVDPRIRAASARTTTQTRSPQTATRLPGAPTTFVFVGAERAL